MKDYFMKTATYHRYKAEREKELKEQEEDKKVTRELKDMKGKFQ